MHKFFSNRKLVIVMLCVVISIGLMTFSVAVRNRKATPPLIQQFGNDVAGFTDTIVSTPVNIVSNGVGSIGTLLNTYQENQVLSKRVNQITSTQVRDAALQKENAKLKSQLKLNDTLTSYKSINAAVITRTPSSWQNQIIINRGANAGVKKNMPVLVDTGLAGRVAEVNKTNSKVELITNNNAATNRFAIEVNANGGKVINGIISGYNKTTGLIEMGNITAKAKIKVGQKVYTSGLGGVTPKGLYIGKVAKVSNDDYGLSSKIYISPAADLNDIEAVTVASRN
ncbi:rod shape-determining protein MreC [Nicoliella spurrieriana]|uniref:Cell shape-determining protein MreC n=1 Tax=Nicoliella spurrieriana TaxID=2925830 RepID=A0A976RS00_9LACO|nr:rod shape-determining protein MreC [Nicoliella spurrieriana]UQS86810.1 rod shape-determining protein MreC [Nicoliella spurrieriana]